ncbi:UDP-glycosyltransferase 91C1 [Lycium ferocissimum]|uniref:UDP-glycosyltransferase 91C1 n=1 Tax=Lycium ferocissimum TaxID=112874 RepID=UPI002814EF89|nr:UDP-glycosyltransferase 91C1 [Lycium ferocissimum]
MENEKESLHVVMFPWLAMGHIIPFFHLSKCLAQRGHKVTFISTPRNIERLDKVPTELDPLLHIVSFPLPKVSNLPDDAESSMDIPYQKAQFLKIAFDLLETPLTTFLENSSPDWIVYDYASHWLPKRAHDLGISRAFFSLFTAATMAFFGPPWALLNDERSIPEDYTVVPKWIPFETKVVYRLHEIKKNFEAPADESGTTDGARFGASIDGSDVVLFRTCVEFEPEWFNLVSELFQKPILSIGVLPPSVIQDENLDRNENDTTWLSIKNWLDKQNQDSVIYVALGTEATVSQKEINELALGLEKCGLHFFWVIRNQPRHKQEDTQIQLPDGYEDTVKNRGIIYRGWVPQTKILSHSCIGGFLTHCGWNSVIEALCFGRVLIMFPVMNDQGLNTRLLQEKGVGVEIPRDEKDGSFTSDSVAETVKFAVVSEEGESLRANARRVSGLFGDRNRNGQLIDDCVGYLMEKRIGKSSR